MVSVQEAKDAIRTLNAICGERDCSDCELASVYTEMDCEALTKSFKNEAQAHGFSRG